jgi:two-component system chemotaxis response regulator CheB
MPHSIKANPVLSVDQYFLAIGASGQQGLDDIKRLLSALGSLSNATLMIVLHRPFDKPSNLQAILQRTTNMRVLLAEDDMKLERDTCYVGEPDAHLNLVSNNFAALENDPLFKHRNRTIDLLFRSLALFAGESAIGIVLSGALDDGSRGLAAIHHAGGMTMVLTPSYGPPGMPENAIDFDGPIDCIGTTDQIAQAVLVYLGRPLLV